MQYSINNDFIRNWKVIKIAVIGPGIVGMPMAAMLANAKIKIGCNDPAKIVVIQRNSPTSGWKVNSINSGKSVIGGIEPELDKIVNETVKEGTLYASHNYDDLKDADVILICVQTDKKDFAPDYEPMFESLTLLAKALQNKPTNKIPLVIFESTLAPSSMLTVIKDHFAKYGLDEGKNILLGNSPNRVMPGRLVERIQTSDKIVAGLNPVTALLIQKLYSHIVTNGKLYPTNSFTAEIVKTLENAYRDVRIAFSAEVARYCDENGIDFFSVRDRVNALLEQEDKASFEPNAVPTGGLLIPTVGVGGHCLPKDGILLWWRRIEKGADTSNSLIINARTINNESPTEVINNVEKTFGKLTKKNIALLGVAYRFNSEDTRNSPTLVLANQLLKKNVIIKMHDPFVKYDDQNLLKFNLQNHFTADFREAIDTAEIVILCTAHNYYLANFESLIKSKKLKGVYDGCNIFSRKELNKLTTLLYTGIGKGTKKPSQVFVNYIYQSFQVVEHGVANEVYELVNFFNNQYINETYNKIKFEDVQQLSATCGTGCKIINPDTITVKDVNYGFSSKLVQSALNAKIAKQGLFVQ